jgi:hypothetical protein
MQKTVTPAVIAANRENAKKSTGPKTEAGRKAVRNNAMKNGLLTKTVVFKDEEDRKRFEALYAEFEADLAPEGSLENMIVADIVVSWWKLQTVYGLQIQELDARQGRAAEILNTFASNARAMDSYFLEKPKALSTSASASWECRELSLRNLTSNAKEEKNQYTGNLEGEGNITFEAKLGSAADSLIRYENLWKKNLYRAITSLREMQADRLNTSKETAILQNKPSK